jgi:hypothetical protein
MDTSNLDGFPDISNFKVEDFEFNVSRFDQHRSGATTIGYFVLAFNRDTKKSTTLRVIRSVNDAQFSAESNDATATEKLTLDVNDPAKLLIDALKTLGYVDAELKLTAAFHESLNEPAPRPTFNEAQDTGK